MKGFGDGGDEYNEANDLDQSNIVENEFLKNSIKIAVTDNNFEFLKKISDGKLESEEIELSPVNSEIDSDDEYNNLKDIIDNEYTENNHPEIILKNNEEVMYLCNVIRILIII